MSVTVIKVACAPPTTANAISRTAKATTCLVIRIFFYFLQISQAMSPATPIPAYSSGLPLSSPLRTPASVELEPSALSSTLRSALALVSGAVEYETGTKTLAAEPEGDDETGLPEIMSFSDSPPLAPSQLDMFAR
jgi:hypothetical protein